MSQKKQIFKLNILKKLLTDENSCVSLVKSTRLLALPPFFLTDMKSGILYLLNSMLKKYDRTLGGIVIGYQNIKVLMDENTGIIPIGTSEMEVNISVEFYIFQPKIGSYLEGVINKKSNNHIGCLVHQYFNATILKPEDILYEDWICKDFNVDDKIIFKVIDLDFTTLLPYVEGIYDGKILLDNIKSNSSQNCNTDNMVTNNANTNSENKETFSSEFLKGGTNSDAISDDFLNNKKGKRKSKELNVKSISSNLEESHSTADCRIKKKTKKKEKLPVTCNLKGHEVNISFDKEITQDMMNEKFQNDEKRKKKKRKEDEDKDQEGLAAVRSDEKKENSTLLPDHIQGKLLELEDENSNDFVKINKSKKEKKKKSQSKESFPNSNKTNECLPFQEAEDSVFYSTQLEPVLGSGKMRISFCSPIPQSNPFEGKAFDKSVTSSVYQNNQENLESVEKETKKKHKKRKREKQEELQDSPASKKMKISVTSFKNEDTNNGKHGNGKKSIVESVVEQLFQAQLNRVKEELNMSSSDKEERKKKEKKKKKIEYNESVVVNNIKPQLNGGDRKSELQSSFSELFRQELQKVKEEFSISGQESFKEGRKKKMKVRKEERETSKEVEMEGSSKVKESNNTQMKCTNGNEKKCDMKSMIDELYKQKINRRKEEELCSNSCTGDSKEKKKKMSNNQEASKEKPLDSLYDRLLKEAKNRVDLEKISASILPPATESGRRKKDSELSDLSNSSSKNKKSKHSKQKIEDCHQPSSKFKNGSMYDVAPTPEKINPDKSLFSDSEQSHSSPVKKKKGINAVEMGSGKSKVQNLLDEFYKEEIKRLKSESDKESQKGLEKNIKKGSKSEGKSKTPSTKDESLYEKLLKDARSLIHVRDVSLPVKKETKGKIKKKIKTVQDCHKIQKNEF